MWNRHAQHADLPRKQRAYDWQIILDDFYPLLRIEPAN